MNANIVDTICVTIIIIVFILALNTDFFRQRVLAGAEVIRARGGSMTKLPAQILIGAGAAIAAGSVGLALIGHPVITAFVIAVGSLVVYRVRT